VFRLYDTRTKHVEAIKPGRGGLLRMFTCGPAGYRDAHVGDLRSYLLADLIRRNAEHRHRLTVLACQNISDVGRLARSREEAFRADCSALNLHPPQHSPRTSEGIGLMTGMISSLIEAGHAYRAPGGCVYFDARSFPGYGELSGNSGTGRSGSGGTQMRPESGEPAGRRFRADWALWEGAPAGRQPAWPAPWGAGLPGWPTECSALSLHYLGDAIDLHAGGVDLCFPHHEDERAQSNSLAGHEVVRQWVHGGQVLFGGRRMAGPAGNMVLLSDLTDRGLDPLALRLAFLEHRYRQQVNLGWDTLSAADRALRRWRQLVAEWACSPSKPMTAAAEVAEAFDADLDTPAALRVLRGLENDPQIAPGSKFESFAHADQLLGLDLAREVGR